MNSSKRNDNWDVEKVRKDFPVLSQTVNGKPLRYLDNGASSQVPHRCRPRFEVFAGRAFEYSSRRALSIAARDDRIRGSAGKG